ncbi:MAG: hypothetical protein V3S89_06140, partial [Desulfobacterales bacterium]
IRESRPVSVNDTQISAVIVRGVVALGLEIKQADPSFFNERVSIASQTHVFDWPSDCVSILRVWDLETTAGTITGASNASPIVIDLTDHGFSTDDIIYQHSVGGNTAANGTFKITVVGDDSYSLNGSTGNAAWTSGGKAYQDPVHPQEITKIELEQSDLGNPYRWYPRKKKIIVDDNTFTNDIILDYDGRPDTFDDIPADYHDGLAAYGIDELIVIPDAEDRNFQDRFNSQARARRQMARVINDIKTTMKSSTEPKQITDVWHYGPTT